MIVNYKAVAAGTVDLQSLNQLIEGQVPEDEVLEYKQTWCRDAQEFCKDISALANTKGGVIAFGVTEEDGCAGQLEGVGDVDDRVASYVQAVASNVRPTIILQHQRVRLTNGKDVVLFATPMSRSGPHMTVARGVPQIFKRAGTVAQIMTVDELRSAFLHSRFEEDVVLERHWEHLKSAYPPAADEYGICIDVFPLPLDAERFDVSDDLNDSIQNIFKNIWSIVPARIAFDGFALGATEKSTARVRRSGWISITHLPHLSTDDSNIFPQVHFITRLLLAVEALRECMNALTIQPPWYICMTLYGMQGRTLAKSSSAIERDAKRIDLDMLKFEPLMDNDLSVQPHTLVQSWCNRLWQAAGLQRCDIYDKETGAIRPGALR